MSAKIHIGVIIIALQVDLLKRERENITIQVSVFVLSLKLILFAFVPFHRSPVLITSSSLANWNRNIFHMLTTIFPFTFFSSPFRFIVCTFLHGLKKPKNETMKCAGRMNQKKKHDSFIVYLLDFGVPMCNTFEIVNIFPKQTEKKNQAKWETEWEK